MQSMNVPTQNEPLTPMQAYKYCPKCGGRFTIAGGNLLTCAQCGYKFFVNAAPAAGAIICNDKREVLFVQRKFAPYKGTWQLPGGFINPQETYEHALHREIEEELSVKISVEQFAGTLPMPYLYSGVVMPVLCIYSTATIISGEITPRDDVMQASFFAVSSLHKLDLTFASQSNLVARVMQ